MQLQGNTSFYICGSYLQMEANYWAIITGVPDMYPWAIGKMQFILNEVWFFSNKVILNLHIQLIIHTNSHFQLTLVSFRRVYLVIKESFYEGLYANICNVLVTKRFFEVEVNLYSPRNDPQVILEWGLNRGSRIDQRLTQLTKFSPIFKFTVEN